jgi:hypothetical protein
MAENDHTRFQELLQVLVKIIKSKRHAEIDIKFNGTKLIWNVTFGGIRAHEFDLDNQHSPDDMVDP